MILRRYLYKEIIQTFFACLLVLTLIAVSNKFVSLITKAAVGEFPPEVLFHMIWFIVPEIMAIILPISYFLAILLCFGKLFVDLEIPLMLACGISWRFLSSTALILGIPVATVSLVLSTYLSPMCYQYRDILLQKEDPVMLAQAIVPGRFHAIKQGQWILYATNITADEKEIKNIFIAEQPSAKGPSKDWSVLSAETGKVVRDSDGSTYVQLTSGKRYQGYPGEQDYSVITFDEYQRLLEQKKPRTDLFYHRSMPTRMLFDNLMPSNMAELQWRLSVPLMTLLLAFFAVPISRVQPRKGRFSKIFVSVISAIVYINLLTLSKRWVEAEVIPGFIGVWWVHIGFFAVSCCLLMNVSGQLQGLKALFKSIIGKNPTKAVKST